ncbi:MAG: isopentenyl-diphosphate Delta-isomerase, partial [Clostridiales Family XIII bacterium]|nr:isopentenyl-diphosphate Delta-isomerase [Clostridiales Family XIII bacterium]
MTVISKYIEYLLNTLSSELFDNSCRLGWLNIANEFADIQSKETIAEVILSNDSKTCDYSIRVDTDYEKVREYWLELDHDQCQEVPIIPCYFIDASHVVSGENNAWVYTDALPHFLSEPVIAQLKPKLDTCINALPRGSNLFQLGVMSGRGEKSIRVFTDRLYPDEVLNYLHNVGWAGNFATLQDLLRQIAPFTEDGQFLLDFDVFEYSISEKLGINFGITNTIKKVTLFLDHLIETGLCTPNKKRGVLHWLEAPPNATPYIQNDISHYKIPFIDGQAMSAKAYLRQGTDYYQRPQPIQYHRPALMNLELTSRCPLRCPQCYCNLESGRDMPKETALYWIKQAAEEGVDTINLSGGETMCYPYLYDIVSEAAKHIREVNIAISGAAFTEQSLQKLTDAGVTSIYVSLNGSSEEINVKSRDGYALAIQALALLQDAKFPHIGINWVMHRNNAEDFINLITLAERYNVHEITILSFKPDAQGNLTTMPTREQMDDISKFIRSYKGPIMIVVEECFSQLRAVNGKRFLANLNTGIERGCGAGRDGFSVAIDGSLTPCRHLYNQTEKFDTIASYWEQSPILQKLRSLVPDPHSSCGVCQYKKNCLPCIAVSESLEDTLSMDGNHCPINLSDKIILIDENDIEIGNCDKTETHEKALLHRAFSIFIYHEDKMLIQQRAFGKYHSGGLWANACCSHPRFGENLADATKRRLHDELGIPLSDITNNDIKEIFSFTYKATFENGLTEHELDHVFVLNYSGKIDLNKEEIETIKWISFTELKEDLDYHPEKYAIWFQIAAPDVINIL